MPAHLNPNTSAMLVKLDAITKVTCTFNFIVLQTAERESDLDFTLTGFSCGFVGYVEGGCLKPLTIGEWLAFIVLERERCCTAVLICYSTVVNPASFQVTYAFRDPIQIVLLCQDYSPRECSSYECGCSTVGVRE